MKPTIKKNHLWMVTVWRGLLQQTKVTFHRRNREAKIYFPRMSSMARLAPHMKDLEVRLSPNYIDLILYPR